jgi:SAM-dependent methyltransferase
MGRDRFESAYEGAPPWDIPRPQPEIEALEERGLLRGKVLDAGCGTGENAIFLGSRGHEVCGIDFIPRAIERARAKAHDRGVNVRFEVADALQLGQIGTQFDTIIDCGLFHTFDDADRPTYVASLRQAVKPGGHVHILCFSDHEPPGAGPRRITRDEIVAAFDHGWKVESIEPARFATNDHPEARTFTPGGPHAWLATILRLQDELPD